LSRLLVTVERWTRLGWPSRAQTVKMQRMKLFILAVAAATSLFACAPAKDSSRWTPYAGCGESQCRSWNSSCEADCMNKSVRKDTVNADECMSVCGSKMSECKQSCTAIN
jgi:hypothetical protein